MAVRTEVSVVRAMEGKARRVWRKRPTSSAARRCESAALPPLPHHRILFPASRQSVMRTAARSNASSCATNWRTIVRCSAIASAKTPDRFNEDGMRSSFPTTSFEDLRRTFGNSCYCGIINAMGEHNANNFSDIEYVFLDRDDLWLCFQYVGIALYVFCTCRVVMYTHCYERTTIRAPLPNLPEEIRPLLETLQMPEVDMAVRRRQATPLLRKDTLMGASRTASPQDVIWQ